MKYKAKQLKQLLLQTEKPDILFLQETHFHTLQHAKSFLSQFAVRDGQTRGLSLSNEEGKRGVMCLIPKGSALYGLVTDVAHDSEGRWSVVRIDAKDTFIHVINVYAPDKEEGRAEFFDSLAIKFRGYENKVFVGDWNYVTQTMDKVSLNSIS